MNLIIKNAIVYDAQSPYNNQQVSIYIKNGVIEKISKKFSTIKNYTVIESPNLCVSIGWVDIFSNFNDPGNEQNETIASGIATAKAGGFTDVCVLPNTQPTLSNKAAIEFIKSKAHQQIVNIHPIGAITKNIEGKDLSEMYDMHNAGAILFSDGIQPVQSAGLLLKALLYTKAIKATIVQIPDDTSLSKNGLIHEGNQSVRLGFSGKPDIAEHIQIKRDIDLANYANAPLHFTGISSKESVHIIREAKKINKHITCSVTPYHLLYNDTYLEHYDSNFKVNPPLRTEEDRLALIQGVKDGTIDCIASHHSPHCWDEKIVEFEYAQYGMNTLQSCFSMLHLVKPALTTKQIIKLLTHSRSILLKQSLSILEGKCVNMTLFDSSISWSYNKTTNQSLSNNSPLYDSNLLGKVIGTINNNQIHLNAY